VKFREDRRKIRATWKGRYQKACVRRERFEGRKQRVGGVLVEHAGCDDDIRTKRYESDSSDGSHFMLIERIRQFWVHGAQDPV